MKLSIIVVNYNTANITLNCLKSIEKHPFNQNFEVILVDNNSTDNSEKILKKFKSNKFKYKFIKNNSNLGFSKGNNIGLKASSGKYKLLLNSDTEVTKGALNKLFETAENNPEAGIVGARLLNADGTIQPSVYNLPTIFRVIKDSFIKSKTLEKYYPKSKKVVEVESVVGAAFLITPKAYEKGGFLNEKYFMYFEDLDYCRQVSENGLKILYDPSVKIYHLHGASGDSKMPNDEHWKRLIPSSKIYHGLLKHYFIQIIMRAGKFFNENKIIFIIALLAFFIRNIYLPEKLFFGYEQARDLLKIKEIIAGDLVLIGPKTDINGIFHGPISYYLYIPIYLISFGNPYSMIVQIILLHAISIVFLYDLISREYSTKAAVVGSVIYSFSYSAITYSRWLLHLNLVPFFLILTLWSLNRSKKMPQMYNLSIIFASIAGHLALQNWIIGGILIILYLITFRPKLTFLNHLIAILTVGFFMLPYILFDIKNNGLLINSVLSYLSERSTMSLGYLETLDELKNEIKDNVFVNNLNLSLITFGLLIAATIKLSFENRFAKFIMQFFFSIPLLYMVFQFKPLRHFYIYLPFVIAIIFASVYQSLKTNIYKYLFACFVIIVCLSNIYFSVKRLANNESNFIHHAQHTYLGDQLALIDYIYKNSNGQDFTYDYYSIPYWKNEAWEYLFGWYGKLNYGYLPAINTRTEIFYVLYEPDESQPLYQKNWMRDLNDESDLIDTYISGKLTVEKRKIAQ